jgi:ankyrin repeat protein/uncharacterized protein YegL
MFEDILQTLTCPITLDLIEDPVQVPCCGKSVSRTPLAIALQFRAVCPLCRSDLSTFDVAGAPPNRTLASIVERFHESPAAQNGPKEHQWSGQIDWLRATGPAIGRLNLSLARSHFSTKRTLFVAIVDKSGSMAGSPWRQVQTALVHILGLTSVKMAAVETRIITYSSTADLLPPMSDPSQLPLATSQIAGISAGGGTNFLCAYQKLADLLESMRERASSFSSVSIAFLTDGQAQDDKSTLTAALSRIFVPFAGLFRVIVHSIGFSQDCDKHLLEQMRTAGTSEGTFRYAEPSDDSDALCGKLTDLFALSERAATAAVRLALHDGLEFVRAAPEHFIHIEQVSRAGALTEWVRAAGDPPSRFVVRVDSSEDAGAEVAVIVKSCGEAAVMELWLRRVLDGMAEELLDLNRRRAALAPLLLGLHSALYASRLKAIRIHLDDPRIDGLRSQMEAIAEGRAVNEGRLADMRFASMFSAAVTRRQPAPAAAAAARPAERAPAAKEIMYVEMPVRYSHNHSETNRNAVQRAIMDGYPRRRTEAALTAVGAATDEDLHFADNDGNTALHLAAYCGSPAAIEAILARFPIDGAASYVNTANKKGETAITLAIKRRGFHESMLLLNAAGAVLAATRVEPLKRFCVQQRFVRTADILSNLNTSSGGMQLDLSMNAEYVVFQWESAKRRGTPRPARTWLQVALAKALVDIVAELVAPDSLGDFEIPWQWFIDYCFPPKPDHPEVEKYIALATLVLDAQPALLAGRDPASGDTTLILSVQKGNLPHVQLVLDRGAPIDEVNALGNTALWVACAKRYPCIIGELLARQADVNLANEKGNRPLTAEDNAILQSATPLHLAAYYGRHASAKTLLELGADPNSRDVNGMTPLHIAVLRKHEPLVELLIGSKADPFITDRSGNSPAAFSRDPKVLALLVNPVTAPLHELAATRLRSGCGFTVDEVRDLLVTKSAAGSDGAIRGDF